MSNNTMPTTLPSSEEIWEERRKAFLICQSRSDLVKFLSSHTFTAEDLVASLEDPAALYQEFSIRKTNGKRRYISAPTKHLLHVQKFISNILYAVFEIPEARIVKPAHGFMPKRSILTNATYHLGSNCILNLDLVDFFPSISQARVFDALLAKPVNMTAECAEFIANLCCLRGRLPQGAPTSPPLSNLVCRSLDFDLQRFAARNNIRYSRYADDITISSVNKHIKFARKIFDAENTQNQARAGRNRIYVSHEIIGIIARHGFSINEEKTKLLTPHDRMEVTGIIINNTPNKSKEYISNIRAMLHSWEKYGLANAQERFRELASKAAANVRRTRKNEVSFIKALRGKIEHLGFVKGVDDPVYQKFTNKMNVLLRTQVLQTTTNTFIKNTIIRNNKNILDNRMIILIYNSTGKRISIGLFLSKNIFVVPWTAWRDAGEATIYAEIVQAQPKRGKQRDQQGRKSRSGDELNAFSRLRLECRLDYANSEKNFSILSITRYYPEAEGRQVDSGRVFTKSIGDEHIITSIAESSRETDNLIIPTFIKSGHSLRCDYSYIQRNTEIGIQDGEQSVKHNTPLGIDLGSPVFDTNEHLYGFVTKINIPEIRILDIKFIFTIFSRIFP